MNLSTSFSFPLPWQQRDWSRLQQSLQQEKLPHALLITGPAGVGKHGFASAFCHFLLCRQRGEQQSCGGCKACQLLAVGNHPDLHWVTLEEKSQALKIDQIRALVTALAKTPQIGERHCVIIEPADCLNINAANALLKLLEEPPGDAVLMLVSVYPNRLAATLRSRCRRIALTIPAREKALQWLQAQGLDSDKAGKALAVAHGAPLKAMALCHDDGLDDYQAVAKQLAGVLSRHLSVVAVAADFADRPQAQVADMMLDWLRQAAPISGQFGLSTHLPKALSPYLGSIGDGLALFQFYDKLCKVKTQLLSSANPNKPLLWEECLLDWQALIRLAPHSTSGAIKVAN